MPITFYNLLFTWEYEWKCQKEENKNMIIMAHTFLKFEEELKYYGEYELYINNKIKTPIGNQMTLEDVL